MSRKPYQYVFYNARWYGYLGLLFGLGLLAVAIFGAISQQVVEMACLFFLLIAGVFIWIGWRTVIDGKPVLQFGRDGIWTRKLEATSWQEVVLTYRTVSNPKSGSIESLIILDRKTHQQLDWVPLTAAQGSTEKIKELRQAAKRLN